jgi:hypothetical protein
VKMRQRMPKSIAATASTQANCLDQLTRVTLSSKRTWHGLRLCRPLRVAERSLGRHGQARPGPASCRRLHAGRCPTGTVAVHDIDCRPRCVPSSGRCDAHAHAAITSIRRCVIPTPEQPAVCYPDLATKGRSRLPDARGGLGPRRGQCVIARSFRVQLSAAWASSLVAATVLTHPRTGA